MAISTIGRQGDEHAPQMRASSGQQGRRWREQEMLGHPVSDDVFRLSGDVHSESRERDGKEKRGRERIVGWGPHESERKIACCRDGFTGVFFVILIFF